MLDHRENHADPLDVQYGPAHEVELADGGMLHHLTGVRRVRVNSLHSQGVGRLGKGLLAEARADDGLIEAFRVEGAPAFALAVQWHPEWKAMDNPFSRALFAEFGRAGRERAARLTR
jgi:putative glutamine amidotransferase